MVDLVIAFLPCFESALCACGTLSTAGIVPHLSEKRMNVHSCMERIFNLECKNFIRKDSKTAKIRTKAKICS
jgi:hypothetical protein